MVTTIAAAVALQPAALRSLTDDELAALHQGAGEDLAAAIRGEAERRDRDERAAARRRQARRNDPVRQDWETAAYAQYLEAERELRGNLVRRGSAITDAWALWSGPEHVALANASEELRLWWQQPGHARITQTEYARIVRADREANHDDELAEDDSDRIRRDGGGGPEGTAGSGHSRADAVPAAPAGGQAQDQHDSGAAAGAGRPVRGGPVTTVAYRADKSAVWNRIHRERMAEAAQAGHAMPQHAAHAEVAVREPATVATADRHAADGAEMIGYIRRYLSEYAAMTAAQLDVTALWAVHAHVRDGAGRLAWRATPRLMFMSSEPGSGKSRCLELLGRLCPFTYGLDTEPTAAGLAHTLDKEHATVLLDESDVLFGKGSRREGVRAILLSGYTRNGTVLKMRGSRAERAKVFGPVSMAGLDVLQKATGDALTALLDRCVIVRMTKAGRDLPDLGLAADRAGEILRGVAAAWTQEHVISLITAEPEMPDGIRGRAAQIWAPLLAIADEIGGDWPARAREACVELALHGGIDGDGQADAMDELAQILGAWDAEGTDAA